MPPYNITKCLQTPKHCVFKSFRYLHDYGPRVFLFPTSCINCCVATVLGTSNNSQMQRSTVEVLWKEKQNTNIYRLGINGKVNTCF